MKYLELFEEYIYKDFGHKHKDKFIKAMNIKNIDECVEYILKNCVEFLNNPKLIRRYINDPYTISFSSEPIDRISRDNTNYYTIFLDNSIYWKDYPKRSKSFIASLSTKTLCLTDLMNIKSSQTGFLVIPNDDSKWGICPADDILWSFNDIKKYTFGVDDFFNGINFLSQKMNLGGISDDNIDDMKIDIKKFQDHIYLNDISDEYEYNGFYTYIKQNWGCDIFESLEKELNPDNNGFKLKKYTDITSDGVKHEVWTDSPCIFINDEDIYEVLKKLRKITKLKINI